MRTWMLAACLVLGLSMNSPVLLPLYSIPLLLSISVALFCTRRRHLVVIGAACVGLAWGVSYGHWRLEHILPESLQGVDLVAEGRVVGLPQTQFRDELPVRRFFLKVDKLGNMQNGEFASVPDMRKIKLTWYGGEEVKPGDYWRLTVRLKPPRGYANPGGFDYGMWLLQQGVDASGYVRRDPENRLIQQRQAWFSIDAWRLAIGQRIGAALSGHTHAGVIRALVIGDKSAIEKDQWQLYNRTGTNHLVAISGLHVGLLAALGYWLGCLLARVYFPLLLMVPAQYIGCLTAMVFALIYCALAGFSLPTSRALVMVVIFFCGRLAGRVILPGVSLLFALTIILFAQPLVVFSIGFWLSFGAVAILLYALTGRLGPLNWRWRWLRPQWVIFIGLSPFLLLFFYQLPWISPLANMLAIPIYSTVVIPVALLGAALSFCWSSAGVLLLKLAANAIALVDVLMQGMIDLWEAIPWQIADANVECFSLLALFLAVFLLLSPRGFPGRLLAYLLVCIPWLFHQNSIPQGHFSVTVLDVGQGLAVVLETKNHTMVYDAGPSYGDNFDLGAAVVVPFLVHGGHRNIDRLVISHANQDHSGGAKSIIKGLSVGELLYGEPLAHLNVKQGRLCREGMIWRWDGVVFHVLNGASHHRAKINSADGGNNASCVIRVTAENGSVLLTGDIEKAVERRLTEEYGKALQSDVLIAPHHGSATSSTPEFIQQVSPRHVVYSAGYRNRFRHPHARVLARYSDLGIMQFNTAYAGAVQFSHSENGETLLVRRFRDSRVNFWYRDDPARLRL